MAMEDRLHLGSDYTNMADLRNTASKAIKPKSSMSASSLTKTTKNIKKDTVCPNNTQLKSQPNSKKEEPVELLKQVDPKVKKMIEEIMVATQISQNDAFLALHDSEYDPNHAVNLLLEAGVKNDWSLATKKKKTRTPGEKTEKNKIKKPQGVIHENESCGSNTKPSIGSRPTNFRDTNFRASRKIFEARGTNVNQQSAEQPVNRFTKGRTNSGYNRRQFAPLDCYNEWDDPYSEYTGSLSNSLVYTCSKSSTLEIPQKSVPPLETKKTVTFANVISHSSQSFEPKTKQVTPKATLTTTEAPSNHAFLPHKITALPEANTNNPRLLPSESPTMPKVFSKPVEMPPCTEHSDVESLGLQFGFLHIEDEFKDIASSEQTEIPKPVKQIDNCEPFPEHTSNFFNGRASQSSLSKSVSSKEPHEDITNFKVTQAFTTSPHLPSIETTNTKVSKHSYSSAASGGARYTGKRGFQQLPYYVTQPAATMSMLINSTDSYQNAVRDQCYTVANSQNAFGTEVLPTFSPTTLQNQTKVSFTVTGPKDFESHNANLNSASRPRVSAMSFPQKSANMPTSHIMANMPPSMENQHPVQAYVAQGGIPYYQAPPAFFIQDMHILQQQQRPNNYNYELGYPSLTRGRVPHNIITQDHSSTIQHGNQLIDVYGGQCNVYRTEALSEIPKCNGPVNQ